MPAPGVGGPTYFQLGLELSSDFSESSDFKLGAAYTRNALNSLGGELRVIGSIGRQDEISFDFYQPIDLEANWYVQPQIFWRRQNDRYWEEDVNTAKLRTGVLGAGFGVGRNFSTTDRMSLNYEYALGDTDVITGNPGFPVDDRIRIGELGLEYFHDSLDNLYFPGSGMLHRLGYLYSAEELGADIDYQQALAGGTFAFSHNRNNLVLNYSGGYSFDDDVPFERWFRLGGLGRLSGLAPDQLSGRHLILGSLAYYRRLNKLDIFPVYAGFTLEAGNAWEFSDDIGLDDLRYSASIFLGADSAIGPVYLAYGHSDNGDNAVYFYVGNPFRTNRFD
jgi:NTE family protein